MIHPEVSYLAPLWWQSEKVWMSRLQLLPVKGSITVQPGILTNTDRGRKKLSK